MNKIVKSQRNYKKHINRCVAWLLAVFMCFSALSTGSMTVCAETTPEGNWNSFTSAFASGDGTEDSPYVIETAAQLGYMAKMLNSSTYSADYIGCHFKIADDVDVLDMSAHYWTPITSFEGTFDGNGVTIKGLYINATASSGFFTLLGNRKNNTVMAVVKNLNFEDATISVTSTSTTANVNVGVVAGTAASATIDNCKVLSGSITVNGSGKSACVGGLVGYAEKYYTNPHTLHSLNIYDCHNNSDINVKYDGSVYNGLNAGGLVGKLQVHNAVILNSANTGSVTVKNETTYTGTSTISSYGGGLIGRVALSSTYAVSVTAENCYNAGLISSKGSKAATLSGVASIGTGSASTYKLSNCYYSEDCVSTENSVGGTVKEVKNGEAKALSVIQSSDFVDVLNTNATALSATYSGLLKWKLNDSRYPIPSIAAQIGDETYESLAAAIEAANAAIAGGASSAEIDLQTDITASRTTVVNAKVILDLNGETLDMGSYYLTSYGDVIDNSTYKTGRLVVAGVDVSSPRALLAANNDQMPVYISSEGAYMLATMTAQAAVTAKADDSFTTISRPSFGPAHVDKLQSGASAAGLQFILRLDWSADTNEDDTAEAYYQEFEYSDELVKSIYTNGTAFSVTVNGLTNYASTMIVKEYVKSDLGVELLNNSFSMGSK